MIELIDVELRVIERSDPAGVLRQRNPFPFRVTAPLFVVERLKRDPANMNSRFSRLEWKPSKVPSYFKSHQKYVTVSLQHHPRQDIHRFYTMLRNESRMVLRNWKD